MSGVGGYVRRQDRRRQPPEPDDGLPRCGSCQARLWRYPHICKEITYGTPLSPLSMLPLEPFTVLPEDASAAGAMLANIVGGEPPAPGPPYVHRFVGPKPDDKED